MRRLIQRTPPLLDPDIQRSGGTDLRMAWADWIRTFSWDAWVTLTFAIKRRRGDRRAGAPPTSERRARAAIMRWIRRQGPQAYAVVAFERGPLGDRTHAHVLIGGLHRTSPKHPTLLAMTRLEGSWRHGDVDCPPYEASRDRPGTNRGAAYYVTKQGVDVTLVGTPIMYRPRRRGPRRGGIGSAVHVP